MQRRLTHTLYIDFEWSGLEEAALEIDKRVTLIAFRVDSWQKLGDFLLAYLRSEAQNEGLVVTGDYLSSFKIFEIGDGYIDIGNDSDHARIVEYGRGPVRPVNATVLAWTDPESGETVFSTYSGPVEPTHFIERTIIRGIEAYKKTLEQSTV